MFKKVLKINLQVIGIVIIGLILVQIISAYFFGILAEKQINLQFKRLTHTPLVKVVKREYNRGWFSAHQTVVLEVNNQVLKNLMAVLPKDTKESEIDLTNKSYTISYQTNITHGLFAGWFHGNILPTIAYAKTSIVFPTKLQTLFNKFFNGQQPLEMSNIIYLNKSGKYVVYSPSFIYDEALSGVKIIWGGLTLQVWYNNKFDEFQNSLILPLFEMVAPNKGEISFKNLEYSASSHDSPNQIKIGMTNLKLDMLQVKLLESSNVTLKLGEVVHTLTGVNSADFLNGIDVINPIDFSLKNVFYSANSNDVDNFFSANATAGFDTLISSGTRYGPMNLNLSLEHINAPQFNKLMENLNILANQDQTKVDNRDKTIAMLKTNLTPIFVDEPVIRLNGFSLVTPSGQINLSGMATTRNFESDDMKDQSRFMQKILVTVNFSVPKSVMAYLFLLQMKYFLTAGNAQMDKQSSDALAKVVNILLDNQLQVWLKKGYLSESNNQLSSSIVMESGVVKLNGKITK